MERPLYVCNEAENSGCRPGRELWPVKSGVPFGRTSVERQLVSRSTFSIARWESYGDDLPIVQRILDTIRREMELPNCRFFPDDPLHLVLIAPLEQDFPISSLCLGLQEEFGLSLTKEDFRRMYEEKWSLGLFVDSFILKVKQSQSLIEDAKTLPLERMSSLNRVAYWIAYGGKKALVYVIRSFALRN